MVGVQHTQRIHNEHGVGMGFWDGAGTGCRNEWVDSMGRLNVELKVGDGGVGR